MKTLFCVLGRTGTGKDTIVDQVCKLMGLSKVKSFTTRPQRGPEDITHVFIKPEEAEQYKRDVAAYTKIGEIEYFATVQQVLDGDFYIIDPKGLYDFLGRWDLGAYPMRVVKIYITVPEGMQLYLLNKRGDGKIVAQQRILAENEQFEKFEQLQQWDYIILNDDQYSAIVEVMNIVKKEKEREDIA